MLANSPHLSHLPLIIDHFHGQYDIMAEVKEGIQLALQHCDCVCCICLQMPVLNSQKLVLTMDTEFPLLEYLYITSMSKNDTSITLPETFQAPQLCHLMLESFALLIGSPLLTTVIDLVTLSLHDVPLSSYFHPNDLIYGVSLMPQLETLGVFLTCPISTHKIEKLLLRMPITTHVTLPSLRWFGFKGANTYLRMILPQITTPLLERLQLMFFHQLTSPDPHLSKFVSSTKSLRFGGIILVFHRKYIVLCVFPSDVTFDLRWTLWWKIHSHQLDRQVASVAQILHTLRTALSTVEYLTLMNSNGLHEEANRLQWSELLRLLGNVKTLWVFGSLVGQLSHCLQSDDMEPPMELLPKLKVLEYRLYSTTNDNTSDAFTSFIDACKNGGHPVALVCC